MSLQLKQKKVIKPALQQIFNDLVELKASTGKPDAAAVDATISNVHKVARECSLQLEVPNGK